MEINTTDFNVREETLFNGTIKYICTPKERKCDHCSKQIRYDKLNPVQFPTIQGKERYIINALICDACYPEIKELMNNNPYK